MINDDLIMSCVDSNRIDLHDGTVAWWVSQQEDTRFDFQLDLSGSVLYEEFLSLSGVFNML